MKANTEPDSVIDNIKLAIMGVVMAAGMLSCPALIGAYQVGVSVGRNADVYRQGAEDVCALMFAGAEMDAATVEFQCARYAAELER